MTYTSKYFTELAKEYEAQSRYDKYFYYKTVIDAAIKQIDRDKFKLLDFGTGNGETSLRLAAKFQKSQIIGLDISEGMINEAKRKAKRIGLKNIVFIVSPVEKLDIKDADFATSTFAFHHVRNKELVLSKIYRILPKGGKVIIGDFFKPDKKYIKEIDLFRSKNKAFAIKFENSWEQFLKDTKKYYAKHPREYNISQYKLISIMRRVGFSKVGIVKMPLPSFSVIVSEK